jgi:7-cyano-7-deazaguanine synthase
VVIMESKNKTALVLLSGGQDSTTLLFWALKNFSAVETITFDYGQRHRIEIEAAKRIADFAKVKNTLIPLTGFKEVSENALTGDLAISSSDNINSLPNTFVPGRNLIFLTYAAAYAWNRNIQDIIGGMCETDYSGYPDCRQNTLDALTAAINLGMEMNVKIHTPLMHLSKKETVLLAKDLGALEALKYSHTCYEGEFPPCGKCPACILREKGFREAGIIDPIFAQN